MHAINLRGAAAEKCLRSRGLGAVCLRKSVSAEWGWKVRIGTGRAALRRGLLRPGGCEAAGCGRGGARAIAGSRGGNCGKNSLENWLGNSPGKWVSGGRRPVSNDRSSPKLLTGRNFRCCAASAEPLWSPEPTAGAATKTELHPTRECRSDERTM